MRFLKKVGGAVFDIGRSAVKGAIKDTIGRLPGANMVSAVVNTASKKLIGSKSSSERSVEKKKGSIQKQETTTAKQTQQSSNRNVFERFWDWMQQKKADPKGMWIFWGIVLLIGLVVVLIVWLIGRSFGFFRKKRASGGRSYSYARRAKAASQTVSASSTSKRRSLSPKQRAALAKGRAALRRKRGK